MVPKIITNSSTDSFTAKYVTVLGSKLLNYISFLWKFARNARIIFNNYQSLH